MKTTKKFWIAVAILAFLSPLGIFLPEYFKAGSAWGEWGMDEVKYLTGYMPQGLARLSELWKSPFPDYAFKGWEEKGLSHLSFAYIISALTGMAASAVLVYFISKALIKKRE